MKSSRGIFSGTFLLKINNICIFDYNMAKLRVKFIYGKKENIFDLKSYIFSDSPWYQLLQNKDYFYKGILENVDDPYNSCLRWPDGQYIRIIELYIEKYKYRYFKRAKFIGRNSWLIYEE